ncbi:MAG: DNA polymerase IV [Rhodothermales bacterium]|nr:DNA polymerase IV [Rhodothermales bacterium]
MRKIIHVDMDAFYASVEQRDDPSLRGRPVVVGGSSSRGVVAAASYEARKFGVHSAMPSVVAARKCPGLVFVKARFDVYRDVSRQVRSIFRSVTDLVEPLSLDEAYLDVSDVVGLSRTATDVARDVKRRILEETDLTASAGVSFNKFLAKVGSGYRKPDGLTVIRPHEAEAFIRRLSIEKFHGVGPVTAGKMRDMGIHTGADLLEWSEQDLRSRFGKAGGYFFRIARARDERPVRTSRTRKSLGAERTFHADISDVPEMQDRLRDIAGTVAERAARANVEGFTVTLKIKYHDFVQTTRQTTTDSPVQDRERLYELADLLLRKAPEPPGRPVRLLGITISNLQSPGGEGAHRQLRLPLSEHLS